MGAKRRVRTPLRRASLFLLLVLGCSRWNHPPGASGKGRGGESGSGDSGASGSGASSSGGGGAGGSAAGAGAGGADGGSGNAGGEGAAAGEGGAGGELAFVEAPKLVMSTDPQTPLYGELTFTTNRKTRARIETTAGSESWAHEFEAASTEHTHTILRFFPNTLHTVVVTVEDAFGETLTYGEELEAPTPALPQNFPILSTPVSKPAKMEPGVTLLCVPDLGAAPKGYILILDQKGRVIWSRYESSNAPGDLRRLANGNLLWASRTRLQVLEVDMRGRVVRTFRARGPEDGSVPAPRPSRAHASGEVVDVAVDAFHHEAQLLSSGNLLALSSEVRAFPDYPTSETDPTPRSEPLNVVGDVVVEVAPSGTIVGRWPIVDLLDAYHIGWDSFAGWWRPHYGDSTNIDWSHSNGVIVDPKDDTLIVSVRNIGTVMKFKRTGKLVWMLSDPTGWDERFKPYLLTPKGDDFVWQYHQHAPQITSRGTLLLFDNGVRRAVPPDKGLSGADRYSRAVEFSIDEEKLEVSTVWAYGTPEPGPDRIYAGGMGDADELSETGNVLVNVGAIGGQPEGEPSAILREVTHADPAEVVFEVRVEDDDPAGSASRFVYRAERLPDIYPE